MECLPDAFHKSLLNTYKTHILDVDFISLLCMYQLPHKISTYWVVHNFNVFYVIRIVNIILKKKKSRPQEPQSFTIPFMQLFAAY